MTKFEVGKMYGEHSRKYEIVARTAKYITFVDVIHAGRYNEKRHEPTKVKIHVWDDREVIFPHDETVMA